MTDPRPVLVVLGGLPGTGKSTVARAVVGVSGASYLRVDTIEQTLIDHSVLDQPLGPVGYEICYALAAEQLRAGTPLVVAECVNPLRVTREAWARAASGAGAVLVDVEVVCSDADEHRRRVGARRPDVPGLRLPTWEDVLRREYEPWDSERLVLDTAVLAPEQAAEELSARVRRATSGR